MASGSIGSLAPRFHGAPTNRSHRTTLVDCPEIVPPALDRSLPRAAEGLGASPWRAFRTVTLPLILPGVLAGAVFAFITSFDEVVLSIFLAGIEAKTLPVKMWEVIRLEMTPIVAVASVVFVGLTGLLFAVARGVSRRGTGEWI